MNDAWLLRKKNLTIKKEKGLIKKNKLEREVRKRGEPKERTDDKKPKLKKKDPNQDHTLFFSLQRRRKTCKKKMPDGS